MLGKCDAVFSKLSSQFHTSNWVAAGAARVALAVPEAGVENGVPLENAAYSISAWWLSVRGLLCLVSYVAEGRNGRCSAG